MTLAGAVKTVGVNQKRTPERSKIRKKLALLTMRKQKQRRRKRRTRKSAVICSSTTIRSSMICRTLVKGTWVVMINSTKSYPLARRMAVYLPQLALKKAKAMMKA